MSELLQEVAPCRRQFIEEFKRDAVRLVPVAAVGISDQTMRAWRAKASKQFTDGCRTTKPVRTTCIFLIICSGSHGYSSSR
jgi:hypothetical protein